MPPTRAPNARCLVIHPTARREVLSFGSIPPQTNAAPSRGTSRRAVSGVMVTPQEQVTEASSSVITYQR